MVTLMQHNNELCHREVKFKGKQGRAAACRLPSSSNKEHCGMSFHPLQKLNIALQSQAANWSGVVETFAPKS